MTVGLLASVTPSSGTITTLYECPSLKKTVCSIWICNTNTSTAKIRVYIKSTNAAPSQSDARWFNLNVPVGDTVNLTGITLYAGNTVKCYSDIESVNFQVDGLESNS